MRFDLRRSLAAFILCSIAAGASPAVAAPKLDLLYSFCSTSGCPDGDQPYGGVTLLSSGEMVGTTGFGGKYGDGTVFSLDRRKGAWQIHSLKSFCVGKPPSCQPYQGPIVTLVADTSGNLYGSTYFGGKYSNGAVFELEAKGGHKYALHYLYSFNGTDGYGPWELSYAGQSAGQRYDGTSPLYGTTIAGTGGAGIVFSLTPNGGQWDFATLYNFCSAGSCSDGGLPRGGVIVDPASGTLYGTTSYYGDNSAGTIFALANSGGTWNYTLLYTFCSEADCDDGNAPFAGLAEDATGNLYGTTYFGGAQDDGVVFEFTAGGKLNVLHAFCSEAGCTDGSLPAAAVTLDSAGDVFGTAGRGGNENYGTLFRIAGGKFKTMYSFCSLAGCADGGYPYGTLALDASGNVYGTTQYGGAHALGEVYELKQ